MDKPAGFDDCLSDYGPKLYDGSCGEVIAWGFLITKRLGEQRFGALCAAAAANGWTVECAHGYNPEWYVIVEHLTPEKAVVKYGPITDQEFGPRGGWKSTTFGDKKFITKGMRPAV